MLMLLQESCKNDIGQGAAGRPEPVWHLRHLLLIKLWVTLLVALDFCHKCRPAQTRLQHMLRQNLLVRALALRKCALEACNCCMALQTTLQSMGVSVQVAAERCVQASCLECSGMLGSSLCANVLSSAK